MHSPSTPDYISFLTTWVKRFMDLDEDDQIIKALTSLGTISIPLQTEENLPEIVKSLESFTCKGYGDLSEAPDIPALRWKLFRTKNLEGENLPQQDLLCYSTFSV